ncbi:MAG: thiamine phosphate synthase [Dehalococcoidales bacterium]|jgi:thiamine-phosphate pyrophosphorylase
MALAEAAANGPLRIIDANLNRIGESLRLLEDLARLLLNDAVLTKQLKAMRHELVTREWPVDKQLLQARNSEGDVGAAIQVWQQAEERRLAATVVANARRVQQSLRVIEELAKLPGVKLDPERFKRARFSLYIIERGLISRLLRRDKAGRIAGLYAVLDTSFLQGRSHVEVAAQMIKGGARIIQLRDKVMPKGKLLLVACQLKKLCAEHDALFIVNDYLDIALAADADGLHLGQDDLSLAVARRLLPIDKLIGCSVTGVAEAVAAESEGADYIAAGAIYPTMSREATEVTGLGILGQIKKRVSLPLVAIGGITRDNAAEVLAAGADSVAMISALLQAGSPEQAVRQIVDRLEMKKGQAGKAQVVKQEGG